MNISEGLIRRRYIPSASRWRVWWLCPASLLLRWFKVWRSCCFVRALKGASLATGKLLSRSSGTKSAISDPRLNKD
jgi:hypothetical protein